MYKLRSIENIDELANMHDATAYFISLERPSLSLGVSDKQSLSDTTDGPEFEGILGETKRRYKNSNSLSGYLDQNEDIGYVNITRPFDETQFFDEFKAIEIGRIIGGVSEIISDKPKEIYVKAKIIRRNQSQEVTSTEGFFVVKRVYYISQELSNLMISGNNVVRQVSRTMFNLSATERKNIASLNLFSLFVSDTRIDRSMIVGIVKAAITANTLTGLKPEQWVDPKVIKIQQSMGERAAVELILRLRELDYI